MGDAKHLQLENATQQNSNSEGDAKHVRENATQQNSNSEGNTLTSNTSMHLSLYIYIYIYIYVLYHAIFAFTYIALKV